MRKRNDDIMTKRNREYKREDPVLRLIANSNVWNKISKNETETEK